MGIIQGNIANEIKLFSAGWRKAIAGYTSGYQRLARQKVDVVLTPETALPFYWDDIVGDSSFYQSSNKRGSTRLGGGKRSETATATLTVFLP